MSAKTYSILQTREVFHLEFLRWFGKKLEADRYCLKGGVNLRFFFKSIRYSEDMDLDIRKTGVERVKKIVMGILSAPGFSDSLRSFGIEKVVPPDIVRAKQTETTQRFKIHLLTQGGVDLFTKIEFSRRGFKGYEAVELISSEVLRSYKMAPLLVPHYEAASAVEQKIHALAQRSVLQARDIFDLFVLNTQYNAAREKQVRVNKPILDKAHENIFLVDFPQFRDSVVAYLDSQDQKTYSSAVVWDEIKLKTAHLLEELNS